MALLEIPRDRGDQGWAFHRRQQMIEKAHFRLPLSKIFRRR
jgi:hypothetical protein